MTDELAARDPAGEAELRTLQVEIVVQLMERCEFDLSTLGEFDQLAIKSAIGSAIAEGFNRGCEKVAINVVELGYTIDLALTPARAVDEWVRATGGQGPDTAER
jgi:hypothetical protein